MTDTDATEIRRQHQLLTEAWLDAVMFRDDENEVIALKELEEFELEHDYRTRKN